MTATPSQDQTDDYDNPWKEMLEHAFPEFMVFYFPSAHARTDWARGHEFKMPAELEQNLWQEIERIEGETKMPYVTSVERRAIQQGLQQGKLEGLQQGKLEGLQQSLQQGKLEGEAGLLERQLIKRFGPLPDEIRTRLKTATTDQLETWADRILGASTLAAVFDDH